MVDRAPESGSELALAISAAARGEQANPVVAEHREAQRRRLLRRGEGPKARVVAQLRALEAGRWGRNPACRRGGFASTACLLAR